VSIFTGDVVGECYLSRRIGSYVPSFISRRDKRLGGWCSAGPKLIEQPFRRPPWAFQAVGGSAGFPSPGGLPFGLCFRLGRWARQHAL